MGKQIYLSSDEQEMIIQAIRNHNLGIMDSLNSEWAQQDRVRKAKLTKEVNTCENILHKMGVQW